ncbi:MAG TPA: hypothetical protein G4O05_04225 [Caldilineae bacterium]|nr:hypothetical protein [Caldilineae bacterium]
MNNRHFRQRMEADMHQTLLEHDISLSQMEQEALRDFLRHLTATTERNTPTIHHSMPGLPEIGWPLISASPEGNVA